MKNYARVVDNIRQQLTCYIEENKLKALIVGLSGGIDSTLCAVLAEPVCAQKGIALIGRSIPIQTNKPEEIERAGIAGELFCTEFENFDLSQLYETIAPVICSDFREPVLHMQTKIRLGNIKARIRMMALYDLAAKHSGLVLSTDNLTEYYLGFWTLHGDHADYGMIQNLWKTEVYELAGHMVQTFIERGDEKRARALQMAIDAVPTDGLGITSSDCEQFGVETYAEVDSILQQWIRARKDPDGNHDRLEILKNNPVVIRHEASHFKRKWPISIPRDALETGSTI